LPKYRDFSINGVLNNMPLEGHDYRHLTRPQLDILIDKNGRFVPDYVIRFENLKEDFKYIANRLGISPDLPIYKRNSTSHKHYTKYFDAVSKAKVAKLFAKDIDYFGYEFGK